jgi:hypothetical protein
MNLNVSLESQVVKAFKTMSEKEGLKVDNAPIILSKRGRVSKNMRR